MKKTKKQNAEKGKLIFSGLLIITLIIIILLIKNKKNENCKKWLFLSDTKTKIENKEKAIEVFRNALKKEKRYKNFEFPQNENELIKKFNIVPYKREQEVIESDGTVKIKTVYDMLLAYAIDEEGIIYKYNMCRIL